jgi:FkbM family methyltransferase
LHNGTVGLPEKVIRNLVGIARAAVASPRDRRTLRRRYQFDLLRQLTAFIGVDTPDGLIFVSTADRTVGRSVYTVGGWEERLLHRVLALASEYRGRPVLPDKVFVEVGANIGTTTIPATRVAAKTIAFEPSPANYQLLRANIAANGLDDKVRSIQSAVSDQAGRAPLALSDVNWGDNRLSTKGAVLVDVVRLDDALEISTVEFSDVGLLWIDSQGHEANVLAGAPRLLAHKPAALIEFWPSGLGDRTEWLLDLIDCSFQTVIDMRTERPASLRDLAGKYRDGETDLLLL